MVHINSKVHIIYIFYCKRLLSLFIELETGSEDQQKLPKPENEYMDDNAGLLINRPHTNRQTSTPNVAGYLITVTKVLNKCS